MTQNRLQPKSIFNFGEEKMHDGDPYRTGLGYASSPAEVQAQKPVMPTEFGPAAQAYWHELFPFISADMGTPEE